MSSFSSLDFIETQPERTRLSWQRTLVTMLTVAGIGGLHDITTGTPTLTVASAFVSLIALVPILRRIRQLRHGELQAVTWQPLVLMLAVLLLAIAAFLALQGQA